MRPPLALASLLLAVCFSLAGCFSLEAPQRRERLEALLAEPAVPVVSGAAVQLAFVRPGDALTLSSGFEGGEALRTQYDLPSPAPGFAETFVAALREHPRFASTPFVLGDLDGAREALLARGDAPVFFASVGSWRLTYDLSLRRYRMSLWVHVQATPAAAVAAGRGAMALPERLWSGDCTHRGPETAQPIEAWCADDGALLHRTLEEAQQRCGRRVAAWLLAFLERGEEQGAFDEGEDDPRP